jgi:hypothetical protein
MSFRLDVARYHKPLSVGIFGGGTLALLIVAAVAFLGGNTGLGIGLGILFLIVGTLVALYFIDMFIWEPRRSGVVAAKRMEEFNKVRRHQRERTRQRARGLRY